MRSIFDFSAVNAKIADCSAERGGFEPPVSREELPTENGAVIGDLSRGNTSASCGESVRLQFGRSSFIRLEFRCHEIPSDELNASNRVYTRDENSPLE